VDKGFKSSPSKIASFDRQIVTEIQLAKGQDSAARRSSYLEGFSLRDGTEVECSTVVETRVEVAYGRKAGEAALELGWAPLLIERVCNTPGAPIPQLEEPAGRSRFALRSDQLVGIEPALEKRTFLPVD
jgi:hypothetical protein